MGLSLKQPIVSAGDITFFCGPLHPTWAIHYILKLLCVESWRIPVIVSKIHFGKFVSFTVIIEGLQKYVILKCLFVSFSWQSVVRVTPTGLWSMGCRHRPLSIVTLPSNTLPPWRSMGTSVWPLWWYKYPGSAASYIYHRFPDQTSSLNYFVIGLIHSFMPTDYFGIYWLLHFFLLSIHITNNHSDFYISICNILH